ncbi:hypothetical protein N752_12810 [Desulforamulus aquiferis]|nr:hypothetical protein N752_12810 [Desulforamulus aquiferis]
MQDNTLSRIIHLVEEAQAKRAPAQAFVDRFAAVYTPVVIGLAFLIVTIPPLFLAQPGSLGFIGVWPCWWFPAPAHLLCQRL